MKTRTVKIIKEKDKTIIDCRGRNIVYLRNAGLSGVIFHNSYRYFTMPYNESIVGSCYEVTPHDDLKFTFATQLYNLKNENKELKSNLAFANQYQAKNTSAIEELLKNNTDRITSLQKAIDNANLKETKIVGLENKRHIILTGNNTLISKNMMFFLKNYKVKEQNCSQHISMLDKYSDKTINTHLK